ncbi:MAG TPA: HNH endonuclease signature motif containing protein [Vicinamibacteria bacterium]
MTHPTLLADDALTAELGLLAGREREATAAFIVHLAEFDARRLFEGAGYQSMFSYCRSVLRLSEDAAYNRIKAARAARLFPAIVAMLTDGRLGLTTVRLLAPHLTVENHEALLAAAAGKGKQDVEELLARWFPQPDVSPSVRKLPSRVVITEAAAPCEATAPHQGPLAATSSTIAVAGGAAGVGGLPSVLPSKPALVRPLAPERYEIRFTAGAETRDLLREAQDLLGHAVPTGDLAVVFHRALTVLVADLRRRKFAATSKPQASRVPNAGSDAVPAAVRREVAARDASRCAFVSKDGHRCGARRFLEFHHVVPRAVGGAATVANIQLRCRTHNGYEVDLFFGPGTRRMKDSTHAGFAAAREAAPIGFDAAAARTRSGTGTRPFMSG